MLLHFLFLFSASLLLCRWVYSFLSFLFLVACFSPFSSLGATTKTKYFSTTSLGALFFALKNNIIHICARCARVYSIECSSPARNFSSLFSAFFLHVVSRLDTPSREYKSRRRARLVVTIFTTRYIVASCTVHFVFSFLCFFFRCSFPLRVLGGLTTCAVFSLSCTIFSSLTVTCSRDWSFISFTVCCFSWRARGIFTGKQADFSASRLFVCL